MGGGDFFCDFVEELRLLPTCDQNPIRDFTRPLTPLKSDEPRLEEEEDLDDDSPFPSLIFGDNLLFEGRDRNL